MMWIKPPLYNMHWCDKPNIDGKIKTDEQRYTYKDCIWRCDDCLRVYILKEIDGFLLWRSYTFQTGYN